MSDDLALEHAIIIDCPTCKAKVNAKELKNAYASSEDETWLYTFLQCPVCGLPMLAEQEQAFVDEWGSPRRVWPPPPQFSYLIPETIRESLVEASRCSDYEAYTASVAMSGRALEGLVRHFTSPTTYLGPGIRELHKQKIIDDRLFEWAKALHLDRNVAAHSSGQTFEGQDAKDLLAFATAICEYVFVVPQRFKEFQERRVKKKKPSK